MYISKLLSISRCVFKSEKHIKDHNISDRLTMHCSAKTIIYSLNQCKQQRRAYSRLHNHIITFLTNLILLPVLLYDHNITIILYFGKQYVSAWPITLWVLHRNHPKNILLLFLESILKVTFCCFNIYWIFDFFFFIEGLNILTHSFGFVYSWVCILQSHKV